jgi:molybdopterin synthase sulfur carrier subunit
VLPGEVTTAGALRAYLRARGGAWTDALAEGRTLRVAVDQAMAATETPLRDGASAAVEVDTTVTP